MKPVIAGLLGDPLVPSCGYLIRLNYNSILLHMSGVIQGILLGVPLGTPLETYLGKLLRAPLGAPSGINIETCLGAYSGHGWGHV